MVELSGNEPLMQCLYFDIERCEFQVPMFFMIFSIFVLWTE